MIEVPPVRHFTSTGYIVHGDRVLLHWHKKLRMWMPPGGHVEENEDPAQIPAPLTILEEDIDDPVGGPHKHIDFIYVLRPLAPPPEVVDGWRWVTRGDLERLAALPSPGGKKVPPPEDVAELGLIALDAAASRR
ncbi:MAG: hypothetical protein HY682_03665 [Chloroflexi bacterium]|nr:hypothetical protein [Chloroflexota bacterium]